MKRLFLSRWFRDVSISRKLYFTVGIMAMLILVELVVLFFSINTLSSVRAYVGGEGLWSKAQKDAMAQLIKYARTHNETDYNQFREFMKVPMGDHKTLVELSKENPNLDSARKGFVEGRNHEDDVEGMINLFRRFHSNAYIHKAILAWIEADKRVTGFLPIAEDLHREINSPNPRQEDIDKILLRIDPLNKKLTHYEDEFSFALGEGSRWLEKVVLRLLFAVALTVEITGLVLAITVSRGIQKGLDEILVSANSVAKRDFSRKATIYSKDEIGTLAHSFNQMAEELETSIGKIEQEQQKFEGLLDSAPDAIVIINEAGIIQLVNHQCEQVFGHSRAGLKGQEICLLLPQQLEGNQALNKHLFAKTTSLQKGLTIEATGLRQDGSSFPAEISISPLLTREGKVITAAIRDISEKKEMEKEIREANTTLEKKVRQRTIELESKNKELEQFAYVASHDLQEPLRTISGFVERLHNLYKGRLDSTADTYINFTLQASDRMKVLIKDLLDYSRLGRQKEMQPADCNRLLGEVLEDLGKVIQENNARIVATSLPVIQNVLPTEIKLLFQNLVTNSIKFHKPGISPEINIDARRENGHWLFSFRDNGIGIDDQHHERIFIIFQRLHTREEYEGSGIGLAHCKKIVELHGGRIWVSSSPQEGSTFHFTIPDN
ncbi:MAG: PAS domain S-box protein [Bacteroidetes bacterium]|nr:PAS domain S-box protein [Bacteroidota bacterium]